MRVYPYIVVFFSLPFPLTATCSSIIFVCIHPSHPPQLITIMAPPPTGSKDECDLNEALHRLSWGLHAPEDVSALVSDGAVVDYDRPPTGKAIHRFAGQDADQCVIACLSTEHPINFSVPTGARGNTLMHSVLHIAFDDRVVTVLQAVIERLNRKVEGDVVDWRRKNDDGLDVVSLAAAKGRLALVWPMLRAEVPYFRDRSNAYVLKAPVLAYDWEALPAEDRMALDMAEGYRRASYYGEDA